MKKLLLLLLLLTSSFIFANEQKITEEVYDDSKQAVSTIYNDVKSLTPKIENGIKSIAEGLKVGAESVWNILVKQQKVWSIAFLILTLSAIFNWFIFYKRNLNKLKESDFVIGKKPVFGEILNTNYDKYYTKYDDDIRGKMYIKSDKPTGEEDTLLYMTNPNNIWFKYLHLIICLGLSGLSIYHFSDMLTGFINPEYGAMSDILFVALKLK